MKRKITVVGLDGKKVIGEISVRDLDHLQACRNYRASVVKPKKGKGSFKRIKKVDL